MRHYEQQRNWKPKNTPPIINAQYAVISNQYITSDDVGGGGIKPHWIITWLYQLWRINQSSKQWDVLQRKHW